MGAPRMLCDSKCSLLLMSHAKNLRRSQKSDARHQRFSEIGQLVNEPAMPTVTGTDEYYFSTRDKTAHKKCEDNLYTYNTYQ